MKEGDKITYNNIDYTIQLIDGDVVHLVNNDNGIAVLINEI